MDDEIAQHQDLQAEPYLVMVRRMYMGMGFGPLPEPTAGNTAGKVMAGVNHGRWLADCPGCNSALVIDLSELVFMCVECGNAGNEGKWFAVTVPRNRAAIEAELLNRPMAVNRNWLPGETVATLKQENTDHGIGG